MNRKNFDWAKKPTIPKGISAKLPYGDPGANDRQFSVLRVLADGWQVMICNPGCKWEFGKRSPLPEGYELFKALKEILGSTETVESLMKRSSWLAINEILSERSDTWYLPRKNIVIPEFQKTSETLPAVKYPHDLTVEEETQLAINLYSSMKNGGDREILLSPEAYGVGLKCIYPSSVTKSIAVVPHVDFRPASFKKLAEDWAASIHGNKCLIKKK